MRPRPGISSVYRSRYLPLYTVCDVKNVVTLRPFTSRDHNTLWDRNPSCLSVYLSARQPGPGGLLSAHAAASSTPLSLSLSPSFIHSHVSHHRGFRRKRDNAVRVCVRVYVAASGDSTSPSLPPRCRGRCRRRREEGGTEFGSP